MFIIFNIRGFFIGCSNFYIRKYGPKVCGAMNAVTIKILNGIYIDKAKIMTDKENYRTVSEYRQNVIFKMCSFCFINSYFPLIYIAFFK